MSNKTFTTTFGQGIYLHGSPYEHGLGRLTPRTPMGASTLQALSKRGGRDFPHPQLLGRQQSGRGQAHADLPE